MKLQYMLACHVKICSSRMNKRDTTSEADWVFIFGRRILPRLQPPTIRILRVRRPKLPTYTILRRRLLQKGHSKGQNKGPRLIEKTRERHET